MTNMQGTDARGPAVAILCVCLSARNPPFCFLHSPSSFPVVTHTLRIFKILTSTKMSLSKLRFRFKILVSNFVSAWRISHFSNHTQIQKSKFPKSKNIKIFWYVHKIRMYTEFDHSILGREMGNGIRSLYL